MSGMAIGCFNGHMGGIVRYIIRRHVFLLIGLLSLGLFFVVPGSTERQDRDCSRTRRPMHVLIVPMYLVWPARGLRYSSAPDSRAVMSGRATFPITHFNATISKSGPLPPEPLLPDTP